jgi:hypothetical protein
MGSTFYFDVLLHFDIVEAQAEGFEGGCSLELLIWSQHPLVSMRGPSALRCIYPLDRSTNCPLPLTRSLPPTQKTRAELEANLTGLSYQIKNHIWLVDAEPTRKLNEL